MIQLLLASALTVAMIGLVIFLIETAVFLLAGRLLRIKSPNLKFGECAWILFVAAFVGGIIAGLVGLSIGPVTSSSENIYLLGILALMISVIPFGLMFYLIRKRFSATAVQTIGTIVIMVAVGFAINSAKETLFWNWVESNSSSDKMLEELENMEEPERKDEAKEGIDRGTSVVPKVEGKDMEVVFDLPENWVKSDDYLIGFQSYHEYVDDDFEGELGEYVSVQEIQNEEGLDLQEYFDTKHKDCLDENPEPEDLDPDLGQYVSRCWIYDKDISEWAMTSTDGFLTYSSPLYGVPESGAQQEDDYIVLDDKFFKITAIYLHGADEDIRLFIHKILDSASLQ